MGRHAGADKSGDVQADVRGRERGWNGASTEPRGGEGGGGEGATAERGTTAVSAINGGGGLKRAGDIYYFWNAE